MTKKTIKAEAKNHPDPFALRRLKKPDFVRVCTDNQSLRRDTRDVSAVERLGLIDALPKRLDDAKKAPFVDGVLIDSKWYLSQGLNQSGESYVSQLRKIEREARNLLKAMADIKPDAMGIFEFYGEVVGRKVPTEANAPQQTDVSIEHRKKIGSTSTFTRVLFANELLLPPGAGLAEIWDVVQDVENIAHIAAGHLHPQKGKRPSEFLSKAVAYGAATKYREFFSDMPPHSENGWFAIWVSDLGEKLGHPFSPKQAATALKRWRNERSSQ